MTGYEQDIQLERRFTKNIKAALGGFFFGQTPYMDQQEATDFAVFTMAAVKVAVRLRRYEYMVRYPDQFTIRWSRPSGVKTEIDKVRLALVDYMLYGFVDEGQTCLLQYVICDLAIFRAAEPQPLCIKPNVPPDSDFAAFGLWQFPASFVVKRWQRKLAQSCDRPSAREPDARG